MVPLIFTKSANGVVTFEKILLGPDSLEIPLIEPVDWVLGNTEGAASIECATRPSCVTRWLPERSRRFHPSSGTASSTTRGRRS